MLEKVATVEAERKEAWLNELAKFIVEANLNTWAADAGKLPDEDGFKRHRYARGPWRLEDKYTGYFKAPGFTTVYYKDKPAWMMTYGGMGQAEGSEEIVKETFTFLKEALKEVTPDLPYRGPRKYLKNGWEYRLVFNYGDSIDADNLTGFFATEKIYYGFRKVFEQTVMGGIVVHKGENRQPIFPWNL